MTSGKPKPLGRWTLIIGTGIFATTLSQPDVLNYPIRGVLVGMHVSPQEMSAFFGIGAAPWYFKVIAGLLSDSVPLFGTRRRYYLISSALFACAFWLLLGAVPHS